MTYLFEFQNGGRIVSLAAALLSAIVLARTTRWHGRFSLDDDSGVQKWHSAPTSRIGGLAIFFGLLCGTFGLSDSQQALFVPILVASLPAFGFGLVEDITKRVSVRARLLATVASGAIACVLTGASVHQTGFEQLDAALAWMPLSVLFTAVAVGGMANAVNIIDGSNGLASGTVVIALAALGFIAYESGDMELAQLCMLVCAATVGFFLVNFPFGKLFLGDGGAYLLGFLVAWLAVMLAHRNPEVSPWAPLLACAYPIFETLFTIVRRLWARTHPGQPDSEHLHSLVAATITERYFLSMSDELRNSSVAPFSWLVAALPALIAATIWPSTKLLMASAAFCFLIYLVCYWYFASAALGVNRAGKAVLPEPAEEERPVPLR
jgi:UDP-N-acetylmuramyl pentapeptide phosphotransferase/UDP-N-acetylglucosamine-1-phosphate transferase